MKKLASLLLALLMALGAVAGGAESLADQPFVTLEIYAPTFGSNLDSLESVNAAINAYIKPILNLEVNLHIMDYGSYAQRINLMMTGRDPVDLLVSTGTTTTALVAMGALSPLDGALETYGQSLIDTLGYDILAAGRYGGSYYAVPGFLPQSRTEGFIYSEEMNQKYSLGMENAKTLDDIEAALASLKEQAPEVIGVMGNSSQSLLALWDWDDIGNKFGVLMDGGSSLEIVNLYATDTYRELVERMRDWYQKGYIYSEAATSAISFPDMFRAGNTFGQLSGISPGSDVSHSQMFGTEIRHVQLTEGFLATAPVQQSVWCVPHNATDANRSIQFLNLMFSDSYLSNLLTYGIEGQNYQIIDAENGVIDYPDGQDASTKTWDNSLGWIWGPATLRYIWAGQPLDLREQTLADIENAKISKAMGFTFNPANVENEITACSNVQARYVIGLECGAVDPAVVLPEFLRELEAAGIDRIIAEKQAQLDAWAEANGVE